MPLSRQSAVSPRCPASSASLLSARPVSSWPPAGPPEALLWSSLSRSHSHLLPCSWHLWWRKHTTQSIGMFLHSTVALAPISENQQVLPAQECLLEGNCRNLYLAVAAYWGRFIILWTWSDIFLTWWNSHSSDDSKFIYSKGVCGSLAGIREEKNIKCDTELYQWWHDLTCYIPMCAWLCLVVTMGCDTQRGVYIRHKCSKLFQMLHH